MFTPTAAVSTCRQMLCRVKFWSDAAAVADELHGAGGVHQGQGGAAACADW